MHYILIIILNSWENYHTKLKSMRYSSDNLAPFFQSNVVSDEKLPIIKFFSKQISYEKNTKKNIKRQYYLLRIKISLNKPSRKKNKSILSFTIMF